MGCPGCGPVSAEGISSKEKEEIMTSKRLTTLSLLVPLSLFAAIGCEGEKPKAGETSATSATSGQAAAATDSATAEKPEAKGLTAAEFGDQVVANACKSFTGCKNEELRSYIDGTLMLIAAFGLMSDDMKPDPDLKAIGDKMKSEKRSLLTADECSTIGKKLAGLTGIGTDVLPKLVEDKKITFDADKAKACVEALANAPKACSEEKKVEGDVKMSQLEAFEKQYKSELESYLKPCESAFQGQLKDGEKCEHDFVCASGSCKGKKQGEKTCAPKEK